MALSELSILRRRVHQYDPRFRVFPDEMRAGRYVLVDQTSGAIEADGCTVTELYRWVSGELTLAQLRQPAGP